MILTGEEIRKHLGQNIVIDPFDERQLNPNSYNLTLHNEIMTYEEVVLDMRQAQPHPADDDPGRRTGAQSEPTVPGTDGRADGNAQLRADDRRSLVRGPTGAVRARDGRLR